MSSDNLQNRAEGTAWPSRRRRSPILVSRVAVSLPVTAILDACPAAIAITDRSGVILHGNAGWKSGKSSLGRGIDYSSASGICTLPTRATTSTFLVCLTAIISGQREAVTFVFARERAGQRSWFRIDLAAWQYADGRWRGDRPERRHGHGACRTTPIQTCHFDGLTGLPTVRSSLIGCAARSAFPAL